MQIELVIAWIMLIALTAYVLLGGADFGGGIWDLLATVSRQKQMQRRRIRDAIGPIWEANHVWLIVVIVLGAAIGFEALQLVSASRHGRLFDLAVKLAGGGLGIAAGVVVDRLWRRFGPGRAV